MQTKTVGDVQELTLVPRFDSNTSKEVEKELASLMDEKKSTKILLNFYQTEYISSAGLRVLLAAVKKGQKTGVRFAMSGLQPYVQEVFDLSGLSQFFAIFASEEDALNSLK